MTTKTGKPKGRPFLYAEKMRPTSVTLDPETKAKALAIGGGKLARGVRIAVEAFNLRQVPDADPSTQEPQPVPPQAPV